MTTVSLVPETYELDTDDARKALEDARISLLLRDSSVRFRYADGFSYARSIAFQLVLAIIPGIIFAVALTIRFGEQRVRGLIGSMITSLAPGPAGELFRQALEQGSDAASSGNGIAILAGGSAMLVSAVAATSQVQRGASRIYGVELDRPTLHRYALATGLTVTTGLLLGLAFLAIALGGQIRGGLADEASQVWAVVRWPTGLAALWVGLAAIFKVAPNRRQPGFAWLLTGSVISLVGWLLVSVGLSVYLNASASFGETYGPLAGFIGFMLWAQLSTIAILFGLAFAAQLEAFRAGVASPRDEAHRDEDRAGRGHHQLWETLDDRR